MIVLGGDIGGNTQRQVRLANSAGTGQREERHGALNEVGPGGGTLGLATDQVCAWDGEASG